jgi:two-component system LytT family response regulator
MRVLVVDDEPPARKKLRRLLSAHQDVVIVGEAASGGEAVSALATNAPDLVFLDVQMPDFDGFEVLRRLACPPRFRPVFVTAHDAFALRAFEVHALDYLLKPVDPVRFDEALARARGALGSAPVGHRLERVLVTDRQRSYYVPCSDIAWVEAHRNYVVLHAAGREHVLRSTIEALAQSLDPERFARISRSHIVRLDAIAELMTWTHGERQVVMTDGVTLTWTRRFRRG